MHYVTAVRVTGTGQTPEHISSVRWLNPTSGLSRTSTVPAMIAWLDKGNQLFVGGEGGRVEVQVVRPSGRPAYLRSTANDSGTDNLLALPRF